MSKQVGLFWAALLAVGSIVVSGGCKTQSADSSLRADLPGGDDTNQRLGQKAIANCKGCHHNSQFYAKWLTKWSGDTAKTSQCVAAAADINAKLACLESTDDGGTVNIGLWRAYLMSAEVKGWVDTAKAGLAEADQTALDTRLEAVQGAYMKPKKNLPDAEIKELVDWLETPGALNFVKTASETGGPATVGACKSEVGPEVKDHLMEGGQLKGLWAKKNREENGIKMYACDRPVSGQAFDPSTACFKDRTKFPIYAYKGTDDISSAEAKGKGAKFVRVYDLSTKATAFWTRSSPDGRFVGNGVIGAPLKEGGANEGYGIIDDLERKKTIRVEAMYDPGFSPDNKWWTFHGSKQTGKVIFCPNSLLTGSSTKIVPESESRCIARTPDGQGLPIAEYHSMATSLDQPVQIIGQGSWENDNGGNPSVDYDGRVWGAPAEFGENTLNVYTFTEEEQVVRLTKAFAGQTNQGDFMTSPSGRLVVGRFGAADGKVHLGYKIHLLTPTFEGNAIKDVTDKVVGTVCTEEAGKVVFGSAKVQFSMDERFMVTHRYNPRYTPASDKDIRLKESSSDIYIHDLLTGTSVKVTDTKPGVYALYPHFRNDGWLYFTMRTRDGARCGSAECPDSVVATDVGILLGKTAP